MPAKKTNPVLAALKKAAAGLMYTSETEAKLTPFVWDDVEGDISGERLLKEGEYDYAAGTPVAETTPERFFRTVPPEDREKFDRLAATLNEQLTGLKVIKVGATEKDVYVVGRTPEGKWAGVWTTAVET